MSNGHLRGNNPDNSLSSQWQLSSLEDFITQSDTEVSLDHKQLFVEASAAFLDQEYSVAETKFLWLLDNGFERNQAIIRNLELSQQRRAF